MRGRNGVDLDRKGEKGEEGRVKVCGFYKFVPEGNHGIDIKSSLFLSTNTFLFSFAARLLRFPDFESHFSL